MEIVITVSTDDPELTDESHNTGLSEKGYGKLVGAITSAGFEIEDLEKA